jgi:molybdopterin-guanine dinucleotide biosynthesis protein A
MGRDKSRLRLGGMPLLEHVLTTAKKLRLPIRIIRRDLVPRHGPVGGVLTALKSSSADAELFMACDMPFVSATLLRQLIKRFRQNPRALFTARGGRIGFPFLLPVASLPVVQEQLSCKRLSLRSLAMATRAGLVRCSPGAARSLFNVNTPQDWAEARALWLKSKGGANKRQRLPSKRRKLAAWG